MVYKMVYLYNFPPNFYSNQCLYLGGKYWPIHFTTMMDVCAYNC